MASLNPLQGNLGRRRAAHLLRRTSYRFTKAKVDEMAGQTAEKALESLLKMYPLKAEQPIYKDTSTEPARTWLLPAPGKWLPSDPPTVPQDIVLRRFVLTWWCNEALHDPGIGHKMAMFFHQYMITTADAGPNSGYFDYLSLLRWGALGNFKKLATKIITDNIMLRYLNNNTNTKTNPNENFAREFFELFTIGKGPQVGPGDYTTYTEDDIVQAAKVLTGMRTRYDRVVMDTETGIPKGGTYDNVTQFKSRHETADKQFSVRFQNKVIVGAQTPTELGQEIDQFVGMIFAQPETAKNLCRRLYRYFVGNNITAEIETDIIAPLATLLINSNYELMPVLTKLLQSSHFFDADDAKNNDEVVGGMIKSPLELVYQSLSFFNVAVPDINTNPLGNYNFFNRPVLQLMFGQAGFPLFFASDVAGYTAYHQGPDFSHQWFNSSTIIARYKLGEMLLTGRNTITGPTGGQLGIKLDIVNWTRNSGFFSDPADPYILVKEFLDYMLPEAAVDNTRFEYFYKSIFLDNLPPNDWTYEWQAYLTSNNATEVRIPLERLVKAVMYAPEYQTF
jgi:uncharacterized protein (DUF1800 family)